MAVNSSTYSGKQFAIYVAEDNVVGTFNSASNGSEFHRLDLDAFVIPSFNPTLEFEMRTGAGRVASEDAVFVSEKGTVREFSISGRLTQTDAQIFLEAVTGVAQASETITLATGWSGPSNLAHGDAVETDEWEKTLSFYFQSPIGDASWKLAGCVCTSLELTADMGTASGRFNYNATFQTGYKPVKGEASMSSAATIDTNKLFLADMTSKTIAGINEALVTSLGINFSNPAIMLGQQGADGDPEVIARAVPELEITYNANMKYDGDTEALFDTFKAGESVMFYAGKPAESWTIGGTLSANTDGAVTKTATTITVSDVVADAGNFDVADTNHIMIDKEIMKVTAGSSGTSWTVVRGVDTPKDNHATNTPIYRILNAAGNAAGTPPFDAPTQATATGMAFDFNSSKITSIDFDSGDVAAINVTAKVLDDGTNNIAKILLDFS